MSRFSRSSLHHHLDPDLREIPNALHAISLQRVRNSAKGQTDPPVFAYVERVRQLRDQHRKINRDKLPSFYRDLALSAKLRIFIPPDKYKIQGARKKLFSRFARFWSGSDVLTSSQGEEISLAKYLSNLHSNSKLTDLARRNLAKIQIGNSNQGPGLGPTNERRAALALAILKDHGFIVNFQVCSESGKPLLIKRKSPKDTANPSKLNYSAHEEAMAVDIMVELAGMNSQKIYMPLQIKSSGSEGFDSTQRYLTFNKQEKNRLIKLFPATKNLFVSDNLREGTFRLKFARRVLKMALNERKIVKISKKDFDPDIANKLLAMIEYATKNNELLILPKPYAKYSYVEKVIMMIKAGFLQVC
jgi:hypothetical protein